ncbi:MAG: hypothetical protein Q8L48_27380 [Archangium sp.]|nr:hypothetical protein [Archangium sp.]
MRPLLALLLFLSGCTSTRVLVRHDAGAFSVRDYLKTAYQTLTEAETDVGGHRIRAQRETRAALDLLGQSPVAPRPVPFEGPPTLAVALELLEYSEREVRLNQPAHLHTTRAVAELREALK